MNFKKFFNLPMLYTYVVAFVLLIALIVNGAGFVRSGILYLFPGEQTQVTEKGNANIILTDDAKSYYKQYAKEANHKFNTKGMLTNGIILVFFLPFFIYYWLHTKKFDEDAEIPFSVKNLYFYLVCVITLFIALFSGASAVTAIIDYNYPAVAPMSIMEAGYRLQPPAEKSVPPAANEKVTIDANQLKKNINGQQSPDKFNYYQSMVTQITMVIVALPVFLLHWLRIRKLGIISK